MTPAISDIVSLPDGFPVVDLKVRVEKVGKPFENSGDKGAWFRQSIQVSDATGQIEVSRSWDAKDGDPYMLTPGMMVLVSAKPSNKGGQLVGAQKTTFRDKPQIRARAGFVTPIQGQTPSEGGSGVSGHPVASGGHSGVTSLPAKYRDPVRAMTEAEACDLLVRNYERLQVSVHRGDFLAGEEIPDNAEIAAWSTSILIAVGRGDVVRDTPDRPAPEQPNYPITEGSPRLTKERQSYDPKRAELELDERMRRKSAEEIVLEKARQGGYDETETDDPAWEYK